MKKENKVIWIILIIVAIALFYKGGILGAIVTPDTSICSTPTECNALPQFYGCSWTSSAGQTYIDCGCNTGYVASGIGVAGGALNCVKEGTTISCTSTCSIEGARRCNGNVVEECDNGCWTQNIICSEKWTQALIQYSSYCYQYNNNAYCVVKDKYCASDSTCKNELGADWSCKNNECVSTTPPITPPITGACKVIGSSCSNPWTVTNECATGFCVVTEKTGGLFPEGENTCQEPICCGGIGTQSLQASFVYNVGAYQLSSKSRGCISPYTEKDMANCLNVNNLNSIRTSCGVFNPITTGGITIICGNNKLETGEECDDGNKANGDGCDSTCKKEEAIQNKTITQTQLSLPYTDWQDTTSAMRIKTVCSTDENCAPYENLVNPEKKYIISCKQNTQIQTQLELDYKTACSTSLYKKISNTFSGLLGVGCLSSIGLTVLCLPSVPITAGATIALCGQAGTITLAICSAEVLAVTNSVAGCAIWATPDLSKGACIATEKGATEIPIWLTKEYYGLSLWMWILIALGILFLMKHLTSK